MNKIVLYGYYGYQNFGDDLMLHNIVEYLYKTNFINIITSNKRYTEVPNSENVTIYETYKSNKIRNLILLYRIFLNKDYFVWGGGTCFSEDDGVVNPIVLILAKLLGLKIVFIGIGANKIQSFKNRLKMKINSLIIDKIYARDLDSVQNLSTFFKDDKIILSEDIAYLYNYNSDYSANENQIAISLRNLDNYMTDEKQQFFMDNMVKSINNIINDKKFNEINILVLDNKIDYEVSQELFYSLKATIDTNTKINIVNEKDVVNKIKIIQESKFFICVRLHGILVSELLGVKTVGIGYSEKVKSYMERIGSPGYIEMMDIVNNTDLLCEKFEEVMNNRVEINLESQKRKALINFEMFN
jgi:polysaccharide pyruvyl transferase WcaK-like protein